eukprot:3394379-Amphidinium_carterae.1
MKTLRLGVWEVMRRGVHLGAGFLGGTQLAWEEMVAGAHRASMLRWHCVPSHPTTKCLCG